MLTTYYFSPLKETEKKYVDTLLLPSLRVGISRWVGWVGLLCSACIASDFGKLEPCEGRVKSNNPYQLEDSITWEGEVVVKYFPIIVGKELCKKKMVYRRYFTYDDCFDAFVNILVDFFGINELRCYSTKSDLFCKKLVQTQKIIFPKITKKAIYPSVGHYVYPIRQYLKEKGYIGKVGLPCEHFWRQK